MISVNSFTGSQIFFSTHNQSYHITIDNYQDRGCRIRELENVGLWCGTARASESPSRPPFSHLVLWLGRRSKVGIRGVLPSTEMSLHPRSPFHFHPVLRRPCAKSHVRPRLHIRRFCFLDKHTDSVSFEMSWFAIFPNSISTWNAEKFVIYNYRHCDEIMKVYNGSLNFFTNFWKSIFLSRKS